MFRWAFSRSEVRRARNAAVDAIQPLVDGSRARLNGIPDTAWLDPYLVGFMVMLITIVAKVESEPLEGSALCAVQTDAWGRITGLKGNLFGEEVLLLSASRHRNFERGCCDAITVASRLFGTAAIAPDAWEPWREIAATRRDVDILELEISERVTHDDAVASLWADVFDVYIAHLPLARAPERTEA